MWKFAISTLRTYKSSFAGTAIIILLSTALVTAVGVLMNAGFTGGAIPNRFSSADAVVTARQVSGIFDTIAATETRQVPKETLQKIQALPEVQQAVGEQTLPLATTDGRSVTAHDWESEVFTDEASSNGSLSELSSIQTGQVVVDSSFDQVVGQPLSLVYGGQSYSYEVVGQISLSPIVGETDSDSSETKSGELPNVYLSDTDMAQLRPTTAGQYSAILVEAKEGVATSELATAIESSLGDITVFTGQKIGLAEHPEIVGQRSTLLLLSSSFSGIGIAIALFLVSSTLSLSVQQRRRQFALLRAVGATPKQIRSLVCREVFLLSLLAAPLGALTGLLLVQLVRPLLISSGVISEGFVIPAAPFVVVIAAASVAVTAVLGGLIAARRPSKISPTDAIRSAKVESSKVGIGRTIGALVCTGLGLVSALVPLFVPGIAGASGAAMSALLFIVAIALVGPTLVTALTKVFTFPMGRSKSASAQLASANCRGFSRRLSAAIVPLALCLALGCVQIFLGGITGRAGETAAQESLTADLIVTGNGTGLSDEIVRKVSTLEGITTATSLSTSTVYADSDPTSSDLPSFSLSTPISIDTKTALLATGIDPENAQQLINWNVTEGSLSELSEPNTIALGEESQFELLSSIGQIIPVHFGDGTVVDCKVVAFFRGGIGTEGILMNADQLRQHQTDPLSNSVLLNSVDPVKTSAEIDSWGLQTVSGEQFVAISASSADQMNQLSVVLLLTLLGFIGLAAANTLVMATGERQGEFNLLNVIGTKRRQILRTTFLESLIVGATAIALGTVAFLPSIFAVQYAMTRTLIPLVDWNIYGILAAILMALAVTGVLIPALVATKKVGRLSQARSS